MARTVPQNKNTPELMNDEFNAWQKTYGAPVKAKDVGDALFKAEKRPNPRRAGFA